MKLVTSIMFCLLLLFFALTLPSCGEAEKIDHLIEELDKEWGLFKVGSYWVYEEQTLGTRDSIYVYHDTTFIINGEPQRPNHFHELAQMFYASNLNIDSAQVTLHPNSAVILMERTDNIDRLFPIVNPPPKKGDRHSDGIGGQFTEFDSIYSIFNVNNQEFANVVRANNNQNSFYNGTPTLIYSAKNFGIIRKEFPEFNQVWNLVKYKIIQ